MTVIRRIMTRTALLFSALIVSVGLPLTALAEAPDTTTNNSASTTTAPAEPPVTYTYDAVNHRWNSNQFVYNPATNRYEAVVQVTPPVAPTIVSPTSPTTPANGDDQTKATTNSDASTKVDSSTAINNDIDAKAKTGDSTVSSNTVGGNATTGNAASSATLINNVNSTIAAGNNDKVAQFTYNVMGDVKGDIMLYPMMLKSMLEANATNSLDARQQNTINNDLNLSAASGNAAVTNNTEAGNATSGSATTIANVTNILNSMIAANQSFVGNINIYGSLEGDILVAPDFIPQMIANNKSQQIGVVNKSAVDSQNTDDIINNIKSVATSGAALVNNNTNAGSATTGNADTNVVLFNLTNHEVVAQNSLLVFVNVLGKWVGVIVDAPVGATSAMLGTGVTTDADVSADMTVSAVKNDKITNNITLTAQSGNATVANNTLAGSAKSGNASTAANIANISNSRLTTNGWFGVLFINVMDNWYGSFGVDTAYGNPVTTSAATSGTPVTPSGAIAFVPTTVSTHRAAPLTIVSNAVQNNDQLPAVVTAAAKLAAQPTAASASASIPTVDGIDMRLPIIAGSLFVVGLSAIGLRRLLK